MADDGRETYLSRLPASAREPGSAARGEIELIDPRHPDARATGRELGVLFEDEYVMVVRDAVRYRSGAVGTYVRIFERAALDGPNGAVCVAVRGQFLHLVKVFRHATRSWGLECPRGFREAGESADDTAAREIREELGATDIAIERLGGITANSGLLAGITQVYLVTLNADLTDPTPERHEAFGGIVQVTTQEAMALIARGEISDGLSLAGLMLAQAAGRLPR